LSVLRTQTGTLGGSFLLGCLMSVCLFLRNYTVTDIHRSVVYLCYAFDRSNPNVAGRFCARQAQELINGFI